MNIEEFKMTDVIGTIFSEGLGIGILYVDATLRITYWNSWLEKHSGIKKESIVGDSLIERFPAIRERNKESYLIKCVEKSIPSILSAYLHQYLIPLDIYKAGEVRLMMQNVKIYPFKTANQAGNAVIIIEDKTEAILHEDAMDRLNLVLKGIRDVNKLILKTQSEKDLYEGTCKILTQSIGFACAWIGELNNQTLEITPVSADNVDLAWLQTLSFLLDEHEFADSVKDSLLSHKNTKANDKIYGPWFQVAERTDSQLFRVLPILFDDRVSGIINVYTQDASFFDEDVETLLREITLDVSSGMRTIKEKQLREKAEYKLSVEKQRLDVTLRSIGDAVITTDIMGKIVLMNPVAENLTGWTQQEASGKPLNRVFHIINEKTRQVCENPVEKILEKGGIVGLANHTALISKDGTERIIADSGAPIFDYKGKTIGVVMVFRDITDKVRMEAAFLVSQKIESIGILAGGIAHDFNNILTTILGNVSLAKNQVTPEDEIFDLLNEAEMASTRAQTLTRQLLTFAKGGVPVKETASIKDNLIESSLFVLRGSRSSCEFSIAEDLWPAEVDIGQISQVINNIVINANQAMPEGGIIRVAAENLIIDDGQSLPLKPGRYIRISIKDQGVGIAEKHLLNIFDPYFTTKQEGSGIGLATTYSITKRHDGHITVESQLGVGTTFHIYLPASDKIVAEKKEVKLIKGQGKILVMDDVVALRKIAGRILEKLGYEPEFAKDGAEAIRMYKEAQASEKPYHAVILDLTIPGGMGGKDAVNKLLEIDPEVRAIVSSGYSDDPVLSNFQEYGFKGMMPKPFTSQSLSKVLHDVLKEKGED